MRIEDILHLPSMPLAGPSYPKGPYRFVNREYMVISYETEADIVRAQLPEPLEPIDSPLVHYEWINMPDSSGFGSYTESGVVIACRYQGDEMNFVDQMYLDDDPPIAAGREIWGFPKKYPHPKHHQGQVDRNAPLFQSARRHDGLQAGVNGGRRHANESHPLQDAGQPQVHPRRRRQAGYLPGRRL
jgi:acetoacetate decarboxylase